MENFIAEWFLLVSVMIVGLISPGPDFVMTVRNSILQSRKAGIFTALGLAFGVVLHVTYCLIGLATIISQSILLFNIIKYIGAAYLLYIGVKALQSKGFGNDIKVERDENLERMSSSKAFISGFVTNVFNPKATMFFLAMFTQIIDVHVPLNTQIIYGFTCFMVTFGWFSFVATILTVEAIRSKFLAAAKWIDRACGVALIAMGIRLAFTKIN